MPSVILGQNPTGKPRTVELIVGNIDQIDINFKPSMRLIGWEAGVTYAMHVGPVYLKHDL